MISWPSSPSSLQDGSRWMIGAVDLRVAVEAAAVDVPHRIRPPGHRLVAPLNVAALAQLRRPQREQSGVVRPMRRVARHAALPHGRVLPQEGAALFLVAGVALIVDGVCPDQLLRGRAVRVVARGALESSLPAFVAEEVRRALQHRPAYVAVAGEAGLGFALLCEARVLGPGLVNRVAREAAVAARLMLAAAPEHQVLLVRVAAQAGLRRYSRFVLARIRWENVGVLDVLREIPPVARGACELGGRVPEFQRFPVRGRTEAQNEVIVARCALDVRLPFRYAALGRNGRNGADRKRDRQEQGVTQSSHRHHRSRGFAFGKVLLGTPDELGAIQHPSPKERLRPFAKCRWRAAFIDVSSRGEFRRRGAEGGAIGPMVVLIA
jgi:hypothetical protein